MDTQQTPKKKRNLKKYLILLLILAAAILLGYFLLRPNPPKEFPNLGEFTGSVTVSHGNAIVDAKLGEHSAAKLIDTLLQYNFRKTLDQMPQDAQADVSLVFGDTGKIKMASYNGSTIALVSTTQGEAVYTLKDSLYTDTIAIMYEAFPGGIQALDVDPWWQKYLGIAVYTLMKDDFNSPKEISVKNIIRYTYYQMVADGSAQELETTNGQNTTVNIPYDLMLARARQYFTEGASATLKQSSYYDPVSNSFILPALPAVYYNNFPYGDYTDYTQNNYYSLRSLTREPDGQVTAVFEDYNRSGFQEQGTLNKIHYLTMTPATDGAYRFLSKRSELANPTNVSVEGYFMGHATLAGFTPDDAYDNNLNEGIALGGNLLLYSVRYGKEEARLNLYLIDPSFGELITQQTITGSLQTTFWDLRAQGDGVCIRTNLGVIYLDSTLTETQRIELPLEEIPSFDPYGYDISSDQNWMVYTDTQGVHLRDLTGGVEDQLLASHPSPAETSSQGSSDLTDAELLRRPTFVQGGNQVLASHATTQAVLGYSLITLGEEPTIERLNLPASTGAEEQIRDDKIVLILYPEPDSEGQSAIYTVLYFNESQPKVFGLTYDAYSSKGVISGDMLYCFQPETPLESNPNDHYYRLWQVDLKNATQQKLSILVQNASPHILAVSPNQQVLFSYRSPSGSGFGITTPIGNTAQ